MPKDKKEAIAKPPTKMNWTWLFLAIVFAILMQDFWFNKKNVATVSYSDFLEYIEQNKITDVVVGTSSITGKFKDRNQEGQNYFSTSPVPDDKLVEKLQRKNISFKGEKPASPWLGVLSWIIPIMIFYFIWSYMLRGMDRGPSGLLSLTKAKAKVYMEKNVDTTFNDVAGVEEAKEELQEIINFLQEPKRFTRLGGRAPKGILLVGPPGTGKTLLAKAVAGEAKVPFFSINGSEFVELFVGLGAARVRDLFQQTRASAPCILFIDEIDALGKSRGFNSLSGGGHDEKEQTLNQLLAEMDGFDSSEGVVILAATNRPEVLDPALLRAGRFDKQILIGNPDQNGRLQILTVHTHKIKVEPKLDLEKVAALTSGFSGADLANLVNEAALIATRRQAEQVTTHDFVLAIERLVAGLEHKKKVMNADEKRRIAFHEMGHTTVALALQTSDKIHKVSIVPRGIGALGYTMQMPTEDRYLVDENELIKKITVLLGGRASEMIHFQQVSTGASDDLSKATDIARAMVTEFGMSHRLGVTTFEHRRSPFLGSVAMAEDHFHYSEKTAEEIDAEIKSILDGALNNAIGLLTKNKLFIHEGVDKLLAKETLDEVEIYDLWRSHGTV